MGWFDSDVVVAEPTVDSILNDFVVKMQQLRALSAKKGEQISDNRVAINDLEAQNTDLQIEIERAEKVHAKLQEIVS